MSIVSMRTFWGHPGSVLVDLELAGLVKVLLFVGLRPNFSVEVQMSFDLVRVVAPIHGLTRLTSCHIPMLHWFSW